MLTVDPPVDEATSNIVTRAGKAFWLSLGSFLSFVGVIVTIPLSNSTTALYDKAEELGVNQNFLPADELAEIVRSYPDPLVLYMATAALFVLSGVLLATGLRLLGSISSSSKLTWSAVALAMLGGGCMAVVTFLPRFLAGGSVWLLENWWVYMTLVGLAVIAACVAVILIVLATRSSGLARRTGIVVVALSALTIVAQLTVTAPPIVPNLLAAAFAFNVRRAARNDA